MKVETRKLLMELSNLDGPSGYETNVVSYIKSIIEPFIDEARTTRHGSLIGYKKGKGIGKLALLPRG